MIGIHPFNRIYGRSVQLEKQGTTHVAAPPLARLPFFSLG